MLLPQLKKGQKKDYYTEGINEHILSLRIWWSSISLCILLKQISHLICLMKFGFFVKWFQQGNFCLFQTCYCVCLPTFC